MPFHQPYNGFLFPSEHPHATSSHFKRITQIHSLPATIPVKLAKPVAYFLTFEVFCLLSVFSSYMLFWLLLSLFHVELTSTRIVFAGTDSWTRARAKAQHRKDVGWMVHIFSTTSMLTISFPAAAINCVSIVCTLTVEL